MYQQIPDVAAFRCTGRTFGSAECGSSIAAPEGYGCGRCYTTLIRTRNLIRNETDRNVLIVLADSFENEVRACVAGNGLTPPGIISWLVATQHAQPDAYRYIDGDAERIDLFAAAAINPSTPVGILEDLAVHDHMMVRLGVSYNCSTPPGILATLVRDVDLIVRKGVLRNANLTPAYRTLGML